MRYIDQLYGEIMKLIQKLLIVGASSSLLLATTPDKETSQMQEILKVAQESSALLLKTLEKNMKEHMKAGGPMDALNFCSDEAYDLTNSVTKNLPEGVAVKRISNKYRSAANAPSKSEKKILDSFENLQDLNVTLPPYLIQKVDETTFKYYKPLTIEKQVCLKCHGDLKESALKSAIAERYPLDKALGYKMHDLRGVVVVTITTK